MRYPWSHLSVVDMQACAIDVNELPVSKGDRGRICKYLEVVKLILHVDIDKHPRLSLLLNSLNGSLHVWWTCLSFPHLLSKLYYSSLSAQYLKLREHLPSKAQGSSFWPDLCSDHIICPCWWSGLVCLWDIILRPFPLADLDLVGWFSETVNCPRSLRFVLFPLSSFETIYTHPSFLFFLQPCFMAGKESDQANASTAVKQSAITLQSSFKLQSPFPEIPVCKGNLGTC